MANIFANLAEQYDENEANVDKLPSESGGSFVRDTDIYEAVIKVAYQTQSQHSKASAVSFIFELNDGKEYKETIWITNKDGLIKWTNKDGKKCVMRKFYLVDNLCQVTTEKGLPAQTTEEKQVKIWNPQAKQEEPTLVPVLTDLIGKKVLLAITKSKVNKQKKEGDEYVKTNEETFENEIVNVMHHSLKCTYTEAKDKKVPMGTYYNTFIEKEKGVVYDKFKQVSGSPAAASSSSAPVKTHTSLFDK